MTSEPPSLNRRLQDACGAGNLADIATLIADGASVDGENAHGGRPLISAMFCGANQLQAIELLISHGAELDFTSFREGTPLLLAAYSGDLPLMELLLKRGAAVDAFMPAGGEAALHAACLQDQLPAVELLIAHHADANLATKARGHTDMFSGGVQLRGESPLHFAAAYGKAGMIAALLAAGARKQQQDAYGELPIAYAGRHRRPRDIIALLRP